MKVILFQPRIPQNAGNIARTCLAANVELVLIRPLGFSTSSRMLKRAGMDYWEEASVTYSDDINQYLNNFSSFYFFSTKGKKNYTDVTYTPNDLLIFGNETDGLPQYIHDTWNDRICTIPMKQNTRSLNLSNSVSIVLYEALRQQQFATLVH